jgi:hypothetical protein
MVSRLIVPLLCASALAFAYGPISSHSKETEPPASAHAAVDSSSQDVVASLDVRVGEKVEVALNVANAADRRVELSFPSGQTHDVVVLDAAGREVWRWSAGRLFTRTLQTKLLAAGESVTYGERWAPAGRRGTYTLVATLHSGNYPVELRQGITIP